MKFRWGNNEMTIYSAYLSSKGLSFSTTSMVALSEFSGLGYHILSYHFSRMGKIFFHNGDVIIIRSEELVRGKQVPPQNR